MAGELAPPTRLAWLVYRSGPQAGVRRLLRGPLTRVGRSPDNDIVLEGSEVGMVSAHHLEIQWEGARYRLCDLESTNGTYLDGRRVAEAMLETGATIRLGVTGPELGFAVEELPEARVSQTIVVGGTAGAVPVQREAVEMPEGPDAAISTHDERQLSEAVARARRARRAGAADQTMVLMREVLEGALHRSGRRFKNVIVALVVALVLISAYGGWRIADLKREKSDIDRQIQDLEATLAGESGDVAERDRLIERLNQAQTRARALQQGVLYRWGVGGPKQQEEFLRSALRELMAEFGAEVYSVPPEFVEQVKQYIRQYQGPDKPHVERVLGEARKDLDIMRKVLQDEQLPPDLAFMVLVESAFLSTQKSRAGAAGLWQFTPETARAYGLKVDKRFDERMDSRKATRAGCKYIRELILEFGSGSSVMLALAAYNLGPGKVKQAVRRVVENPIKQRDFWYLYRVRALPVETREYVPKVIAAMIIGRNPEKFGF